jgi:transcriptional regulator with XRE-family HTH domain
VELNLTSPPPGGVDADLWRQGQVADAAIGDLWLLSWNVEALALGVIAGVGDDYVLVWPVTLPSDAAFRPAVQVGHSPLGIPVFMWASRETGVGLHMLHRRYGRLLPESVMAEVAEAMEEGADGPLPYAPSATQLEQETSDDDAMVDQWENICLNVWPRSRPDWALLNRDVLRSLGVRPSDLGTALGIAASDAVALFNGEQSPDAAQLTALESHLGTPGSRLLDPLVDESARELLSPAWKDDIVKVAARLGDDEDTARDILREEYSYAPRSTGSSSDRMREAIQRVLTRMSPD